MIRNGYVVYIPVHYNNNDNYFLTAEINGEGFQFALQRTINFDTRESETTTLNVEQARNIESMVCARHKHHENLNEIVANVLDATWIFGLVYSEYTLSAQFYRKYTDAYAYARDLEKKLEHIADEIVIQPVQLR